MSSVVLLLLVCLSLTCAKICRDLPQTYIIEVSLFLPPTYRDIYTVGGNIQFWRAAPQAGHKLVPLIGYVSYEQSGPPWMVGRFLLRETRHKTTSFRGPYLHIISHLLQIQARGIAAIA